MMNSVKGDWTELVVKDLIEFDINMNEKVIEKISKVEFKSIVKKKS